MSSKRPSSEPMAGYQLWGWDTIFDELSAFLRELNDNMEVAQKPTVVMQWSD